MFVGGSSGNDSAGGSSPPESTGDTSIGGQCVQGTVSLGGGDPRWTRACGEVCDPDWCWCSPCATSAPLARLVEGPHTLHLLVAGSGDATYAITLTPEGAAPVLNETFDLPDSVNEGLSFDFVAPAGCPTLFIEVRQETAVCSRLYAVTVDPQ